jgi:Domain of unknown function (DUF5666)
MTMDPTEPVMPVTPVTPRAPAPSPAPAPVVAVAPRARSGGILNVLLIGAAVVAIGGVAFAIGRTTAPASAFPGAGRVTDGGTMILPDGSFAPGADGPGRFALAGEFAMDGTVTSIDADSLTLTLDNGEEMTFALDSSTTYHEATDASATDVAVGDQVSVKVADGDRIQVGGDGTASDLTAGDVTVDR